MNMDFNWLTVNKLFDPGTNLGAITLAIVFIVAAWGACVVTTRLVQRASWVMGRLKRQVDEAVVRYIMRIKNLLIFLVLLSQTTEYIRKMFIYSARLILINKTS